MTNQRKRIFLFLFGCITLRAIFVILAKYIKTDYLPYLGYLALLPAIGFTVIYIGGYRKQGIETFGQPIWWNHLRPIHAILYFTFSYLAITKNKSAWIVLLVDVILGLISFIAHHYH